MSRIRDVIHQQHRSAGKADAYREVSASIRQILKHSRGEHTRTALQELVEELEEAALQLEGE